MHGSARPNPSGWCVTRVYAEAVELFCGHERAALLWPNTPADYLPDQPAISPLHLSVFGVGCMYSSGTVD